MKLRIIIVLGYMCAANVQLISNPKKLGHMHWNQGSYIHIWLGTLCNFGVKFMVAFSSFYFS